MKKATSKIHVISPLFSNYFNRYFRIYLNDIGTCYNLEEDLRRTLLYMMATMNNLTRNITLENNEKLLTISELLSGCMGCPIFVQRQ